VGLVVGLVQVDPVVGLVVGLVQVDPVVGVASA
jgi:hypothetical protein